MPPVSNVPDFETYLKIRRKKDQARRARWLPLVYFIAGLLAIFILTWGVSASWNFFTEKRDFAYALHEFSEAEMQDFLTMSFYVKEAQRVQKEIKKRDDAIRRWRFRGEYLDIQTDESLQRKEEFNERFKNYIIYYNQKAQDCPQCTRPPVSSKLDSLPSRLDLYDLDKEKKWMEELKKQNEAR